MNMLMIKAHLNGGLFYGFYTPVNAAHAGYSVMPWLLEQLATAN
jgi:hypothetical protein